MREDKFQRRATLQANRSAWITTATLHFSHEREKDYSKTKPQSWFGRCGKHRLAKTLFPVQSSWTLNTSLQQPSTKTKWGHRHRHRRHNDNSHSRHLSEFEPEHAVCMWPDRSPRREIAKKKRSKQQDCTVQDDSIRATDRKIDLQVWLTQNTQERNSWTAPGLTKKKTDCFAQSWKKNNRATKRTT